MRSSSNVCVARAAEIHLDAVDEHLQLALGNVVAFDRFGEHAQNRIVAVLAADAARDPLAVHLQARGQVDDAGAYRASSSTWRAKL